MAVKRSLKKKAKAPIKRSIKRAPTSATTILDPELGELPPMVDALSAEEDFREAPLTPAQQAEKDAMEGANAAATANNTTLPEQRSVEMNANAFRNTVSYKELMALPIEERRKLIEADQADQKSKASKK